MNSNIFETWFKNEFVPQVTAFLQKEDLPLKALLLLDNASCHSSVEILHVNDITAYYLPPNVTSLIQPLDQGIIENLKRKYRFKLLSSIISEQTRNIDVITYLKSVTIKDAIYWISDAWDEVTTSTIFKCWKNILPKEFFENNNNSSLLESNAEIINYFHQINNYENINEEDVEEWIVRSDDIFPEIPSNKEILESVIV
ncbi:Jerky-like protein [Cyphomyrmex costatus]|uniref:Jerky-like protein n=1 Tax=Cyphomyrmex costatus TaxID=456900 RepID=A0A151IK95_9HYME|nr:Jerky-like protein [Cyphomyrmex costatus]